MMPFKLTYGEGNDNKYVTIKYETDIRSVINMK